ncbi:hypothetical protein J4408_02110 [Candidatus Pacearchaeota archaeon]|nr:hypothetical protein [Candidatus Pacearchaeota archaeon]
MIVLPAKDMGEIKEFYSSIFGWKFEESELKSDFYEGPVIYIKIPKEKSKNKINFDGFIMKKKFFGQISVDYYPVDSVDKTLELVKEKGGSIYYEKTEFKLHGTDLAVGIILDPVGSPLGVYEILKK